MKQWVSRLRPHAPGLIFGGFFCVMLALHAAMPVGLGDDPMYRDMLNRMSLWQFLTEHYATWSARSLVEAVLCTVAALPPAVWRVADALLVALCAFLAARTAGLERSPCGAAMAVLCFLCYDWTALSTAGWMCTTLVFVWPLAAALAAAQPLVQLARGAAPGRALCAASLLLLAYAANMEQALVVYTGCLAGVLLWHAAARRRVHWVVWAQLAVCAANALYAATCPGTAARIAGETTSWFTDFGMRTIWQNAELGISNAMYHVLYQKNILFFVFCVVLALAVAAGAHVVCAPVWRAARGGCGRAGCGRAAGEKAGAQPFLFCQCVYQGRIFEPAYGLFTQILAGISFAVRRAGGMCIEPLSGLGSYPGGLWCHAAVFAPGLPLMRCWAFRPQ